MAVYESIKPWLWVLMTALLLLSGFLVTVFANVSLIHPAVTAIAGVGLTALIALIASVRSNRPVTMLTEPQSLCMIEVSHGFQESRIISTHNPTSISKCNGHQA